MSNDNEEKLFRYKLACGHFVLSTVEVRHQYDKDMHFIFCPECERLKKDVYASPLPQIPTAWQPLVGAEQVDPMHYVLERDAFILPDRIMRLQQNVPPHRIRPFPYVRRLR